MLRPERMSKVSVTGSKGVMPTVIETIHELELVHLSDYDGSWEGFENGNPIEGAEDASEKLVTVRALESTLNLSPEDVGPRQVGDDWEDRLEGIRTQVNDLDDTRNEIREELRLVDEKIDRVEPFAELGIDLELLSGYDNVEVVVGQGSVTEIEAVVAEAEEIRAYDTFSNGDIVAIVAAPADGAGAGALDDALVSVEFTRLPVPETDKEPTSYLKELSERKAQLEADLESIDADLEELKLDAGGFLVALETELTIEVQRAEAPLQFATSRHAFIAEGWVPMSQYDELVAALESAVGDRVEIEELEQAEYEDGHAEAHGDGGHDETEAADEHAGSEPEPPKAAADGGRGPETETGTGTATGTTGTGGKTAVAGGAAGTGAVTMDSQPPVILNNLEPAKPFELLVKLVSQPKYSELDPTLLVFLTYPFAFGFMIGDIGYGLLYMLMGYGCWKVFDSDAGKALGTIGIWAGAFTIIFGYLFDDIFGVHMSDLGIHLPLAGTLTKGLQTTEWAMLWIILSIVFGLIHLNLGLILGFINELSHGLKAAVYERLSWILAMNGLFIWIFSTHLVDQKPEFMVGTGEEAILYQFFGFAGLPEIVGLAGLAAFVVGVVLVGVGEGIAGIFEVPAWAFGHVVSYLRMVAVLLAKGGMAFAVNLLVFGAYDTDGRTNFALFDAPGNLAADSADVGFEGLIWIGLGSDSILVLILGLLAAVLVFILGHILVLLLGITAAGIQMLRLEYVEFFQKFYEGGGEEYKPFGENTGSATQNPEPAD